MPKTRHELLVEHLQHFGYMFISSGADIFALQLYTHMSIVCPHVDHLAPLSIHSIHMSNPLDSCESCQFPYVLPLGQLGKPPLKGEYTLPSIIPYMPCVPVPCASGLSTPQLHNSVLTLCVLFAGAMHIPTLCILIPFHPCAVIIAEL